MCVRKRNFVSTVTSHINVSCCICAHIILCAVFTLFFPSLSEKAIYRDFEGQLLIVLKMSCLAKVRQALPNNYVVLVSNQNIGTGCCFWGGTVCLCLSCFFILSKSCYMYCISKHKIHTKK